VRPIRWEENVRLPRAVAQVLASLRLSGAGMPRWEFSEADWKQALHFCDRNQLTLLLRHLHGAHLPRPVQQRLERDFTLHEDRLRRIHERYDEIAREFSARRIDWVVLKGFSGAADYFPDPSARMQYDLDLYCPESPQAAMEVLQTLGYTGAQRPGPPVDHLPAVSRETEWRWRGDFFDPGIPIAVEVHFRLWDEAFEGFAAPGWEHFWQRRCGTALAPDDALGYKAMHALRHLLRGDFRASQLYELAWFLHHHVDDEALWRGWRESHDPRLRAIEAVGFALAQRWFDPRMPAAIEEEIAALSTPVTKWLEDFAAAPAEAFFHPAKQELWLHSRLLDSTAARWRVMRRRLIPLQRPEAPPSSPRELARHYFSRAGFHLRSLAAALFMMASRSRR
jgi:hypothetical protein